MATVGAPFIILLSIPLAVFALLTTLFAFWILLFRASIVYAELFAALLYAYIAPTKGPRVKVPPPSPVGERSNHSKHRSRSSSVSSEIAMRRPAQSGNFGALAAHLPTRDYEGVGGWRLAGDDHEEELWMGLNNRLELPAAPQRQHRRSFGSGSRVSSSRGSPELVRTPIRIRTPGRDRRIASGTTSPEGYFSMPFGVMSTMEKGSRVSLDVDVHSRSGSSSSVSLSSAKITR